MDYPIRSTLQLAGTLRGYRQKAGISQHDAGARVGMQQKTVSSLERLPDNSKISNLFKLLSALNLELIIRERDSADRPADNTGW